MKSNLINFYKELRDSINNKDFWIYSAKINTYKRYESFEIIENNI